MAQPSNGSSSVVSDIEHRIGQARVQLSDQLTAQATSMVAAACDKVLEMVKAAGSQRILVDETQLCDTIQAVMAKSNELQKNRFGIDIDVMYRKIVGSVLDGFHGSLGSNAFGSVTTSGGFTSSGAGFTSDVGSSTTTGSPLMMQPESGIMTIQNGRRRLSPRRRSSPVVSSSGISTSSDTMDSVQDGLLNSIGSNLVGTASGSTSGSTVGLSSVGLSVGASPSMVQPKSSLRSRSTLRGIAIQDGRSLRSGNTRVSSSSSSVKRVHFSDQANQVRVFELERGRHLSRAVRDEDHEEDEEDNDDDDIEDHDEDHQEDPEPEDQNPLNLPSVPERIRLIKLAITNSPEKRLKLDKIDEYLCAHVPYFANMTDRRHRNRGISNILSGHKQHFIKLPAFPGAILFNFWAINEGGSRRGGGGASSSGKSVPNGSNCRTRSKKIKKNKNEIQVEPESNSSGISTGFSLFGMFKSLGSRFSK